MRYQVPQFIETETKVIGPFTIRQFIYVAAGAVLAFIAIYGFGQSMLGFVVAFLFVGLGLGLAYLKIDGTPLPKYIFMAFYFMLNSKKYYFHPEATKPDDEIDRYLDRNSDLKANS
jgi:hypothetical protein